MPEAPHHERPSDQIDRIREALVDHEGLVECVLSGRRAEPRKIQIRPVQLKKGLRYQVNEHLDRRSVTRNLSPREFVSEIGTLLAMGWRSVHVATKTSTIQMRVSKRGAAIVHETPAIRTANRSHDRAKHRLLAPDAPFLRVLGVATDQGIRADKHDKYRQIDKFLRLLDEASRLKALPEPVSVVDLGCGNAHLTFAAHHYLTHIAGIRASVTGVDINPEAVARNNARARELGWNTLRFVATPILDYEPDVPPNVVVALHACDTATDDALAKAVQWQSQLILAAPCCHHDVQEQLAIPSTPDEWALVLRHKILLQRAGDLLTDALRATILTMHGYRTDVFQFVATEHTAKNLMIRGVRTGRAPQADEVARYRDLCAEWSITPRLETLLGAAST